MCDENNSKKFFCKNQFQNNDKTTIIINKQHHKKPNKQLYIYSKGYNFSMKETYKIYKIDNFILNIKRIH